MGAGVTAVLPAITHDPAVDVQVVGARYDPVSVMPTFAEAPGAREPFHEVFVAVRTPPASFAVAFHMLTFVPDHGIDTAHPFTAVEPVFVMVRSTLRPVPQSEVTFTATVMAAPVTGIGVDDAEALALAVGATVGVGETTGAGVAAGATVTAGDGAAPPIEQVPPAMLQEPGTRAPPRGEPTNPNVADEPDASAVLHVGPENRYPSAVGAAVASHAEEMPLA